MLKKTKVRQFYSPTTDSSKREACAGLRKCQTAKLNANKGSKSSSEALKKSEVSNGKRIGKGRGMEAGVVRAGEGEARKAAEVEREAASKGPEERSEEAGAGEEEEAAACVVEGEASAALKKLLISDKCKFTLFLEEEEKEKISFLSCVCVCAQLVGGSVQLVGNGAHLGARVCAGQRKVKTMVINYGNIPIVLLGRPVILIRKVVLAQKNSSSGLRKTP